MSALSRSNCARAWSAIGLIFGSLGRFLLAEGVHVGAPLLVLAQAVVDGVDEVPHFLQRLDQVGLGLLVQRLEAAVGLLLELRGRSGAMWSSHRPQVA